MKSPLKTNLIYYIIICLSIAWYILIYTVEFNHFYNIGDWGGYVFVVPFGYSLFRIFTRKPNINNNIYILCITIGALIPILLDRNFLDSLYLQKMGMLFLGVMITLLFKNEQKQVGK